MTTSLSGILSCLSKMGSEIIPIPIRINTGTIVHKISIGVLWVVDDGVGLAFRLYRIKTQTSRALTNIEIRVIITKRTLSSHCMSLASSVTGGWKFIPFGIGFPITGRSLSNPSFANREEPETIKRSETTGAQNIFKKCL